MRGFVGGLLAEGLGIVLSPMTVRMSDAIRTRPCSSNSTPATGIATLTGQICGFQMLDELSNLAADSQAMSMPCQISTPRNRKNRNEVARSMTAFLRG